MDAFDKQAKMVLHPTQRHPEFKYLDDSGHVYLDYTGAGLAGTTQYEQQTQRLTTTVCGNPHSPSPTSLTSTRLVEETRRRILRFLNASPDEYMVVFTPNATGAARLVGEAYPFKRGRRFVLTNDNHNSVNGLREFARRRGAKTVYIPSEHPDLRVDETSRQRSYAVFLLDDLKNCCGIVTLLPFARKGPFAEHLATLEREPESTWEAGYIFRPQYWGKGLATEALTAAITKFSEERKGVSSGCHGQQI